MTPSRTPLRDRIAARNGIPVQRPAPEPQPVAKAEPWRPPWLRKLPARDDTGRLFS